MGLRSRILDRFRRTADRVASRLVGPTAPVAGHADRTPAWPPHQIGPTPQPPKAQMHPAERAAAGLPTLPPRPRASTVPEQPAPVPPPAEPPGPPTAAARPASSDDLWADFDFGAVSQDEYLPPPRTTPTPAPPEAPRVAKPEREVPAGLLGPDEQEEVKQKVIAAIKTVYDPEIPVDIWELGLIYTVEVDAERRVEIRMTLTSPSCPSAQTLPVEVEQKSADIDGVRSAMVDVVWDPPWGPHLMSEAAKLELNID